jgi:hypothetical protein
VLRASILALPLVLLRVGAAPAQEVHGSVYDGATRAPVAYAEVVVLDESGRALRTLTSDARGSFALRASAGETVRLRVRRLGYDSLTLEPIGPQFAAVAVQPLTQPANRVEYQTISLTNVIGLWGALGFSRKSPAPYPSPN